MSSCMKVPFVLEKISVFYWLLLQWCSHGCHGHPDAFALIQIMTFKYDSCPCLDETNKATRKSAFESLRLFTARSKLNESMRQHLNVHQTPSILFYRKTAFKCVCNVPLRNATFVGSQHKLWLICFP